MKRRSGVEREVGRDKRSAVSGACLLFKTPGLDFCTMFSNNFVVIATVSVALSTLPHAHARKFNVVNKCSYTIWPGVYTGNTANGKPDGVAANGGWQLNAGQSSTFNVPDAWVSARIWGRTSCDFGKTDVSACSTGSCIGGLHCTQPGIPPVSLAEFTLIPSGQDNYDVSNVDGSNVPVSITASGCPTADCSANLNANCPDALKVKDSAGATVGCKSACLALGGDSNCCTGAHNTRQTCPTSGGK
jgi:hypothetical protein